MLDVNVQQPGTDLGELGQLADDLARDEMEPARTRSERDVALDPHRPGNRDRRIAGCAEHAMQYVPGVPGADGYFDEDVARRYDQSVARHVRAAGGPAAVAFIAAFAGEGRALELGIGTGRVGLPLRGAACPCTGSSCRARWSRRLRAKPGGEDIAVTIGDFATTTVEGAFTVAYLVFNTIVNLTSQAEQVACFRNVAAHLEPGGCFVIEVDIPELRRLPPGETFRAFHVSETQWGIDEYDVADARPHVASSRARRRQLERFSVPFRYVWPSELDLMAQLAGMRLRERWSDWNRAPFTSDSARTSRSGRSRPQGLDLVELSAGATNGHRGWAAAAAGETGRREHRVAPRTIAFACAAECGKAACDSRTPADARSLKPGEHAVDLCNKRRPTRAKGRRSRS